MKIRGPLVAHRQHNCWVSDTCPGIMPGHTYERQSVWPGAEGNEGATRWATAKGHWPYGSCEQQAREGRMVPASETVTAWNAVHPVGTPVVWHLLASLESTVTATRTTARIAPSGHAVLWVDGESGYLLVDQLSPVLTGARWRELHPADHVEEVGDSESWCQTCAERLEDDARRRRLHRIPDAPAWPCVPVLHALGLTHRGRYDDILGHLYDPRLDALTGVDNSAILTCKETTS